MDLSAAETATWNGAAAGFISAVLTFAVVSFAYFGGASGEYESWNDPWNFLDVLLIVGLSFGVHRRSRAASLVLFVYFIIAKIYMSIESDQPASIGMGIVFLYFFGRAIQGSFVYHRIRGEQDPNYKASVKWHYFVWPPVVLLALVFMLLGLASALHLIPSTAVLRGQEVHQKELDHLVSQGLLEPDEVVVVFYSEGLFSIKEGGNILTERRVISYWESEGQSFAAMADYAEIEEVVVEQQGDFFNDTVVSVTTKDGSVFRLLASAEEQGDAMLIQELRDRWQAARR